MKSRNFIAIAFGIVCMFNACTYSDDGVYKVDPVADEPPIVVASTNLDSIEFPVVNDSLEVFYDISIQNGELYILDVLVGKEPVYESDTTRGSFWIYFYDAKQPGIDTLRMNFYYSSNTNSLADVLGVEARDLGLKYAIDFKWSSR
jgi:hypothetical protein